MRHDCMALEEAKGHAWKSYNYKGRKFDINYKLGAKTRRWQILYYRAILYVLFTATTH